MAASYLEDIMAAPPIRVIRFWQDYQKRDGKIVPVDKVEYCAPGRAQLATTVAVVAQLSRIREDVDPDNPAYLMARARWDAIEKAYNAWKSGQEMPADGTPLAAWSGVTQQQADVLRAAGFRAVEELAESSDSVVMKVPLPGMRTIWENAKHFVAAKDQSAVADAMGKMQSENADLAAQLEEMRQMVLEMSQRPEPVLEDDGSEAPRRRSKARAQDEVAA